MSISLNDHEQRIKNIDTQLPTITNRISKLETASSGKKEIYCQMLNGRAVQTSGAWSSELLSEIPAAWRMQACYVSVRSDHAVGGFNVSLGLNQQWSGGYTSGSRKGDNYNTGIRRNGNGFEIFKGDFNVGISGCIVFYK